MQPDPETGASQKYWHFALEAESGIAPLSRDSRMIEICVFEMPILRRPGIIISSL
jgi:hypothetical protein